MHTELLLRFVFFFNFRIESSIEYLYISSVHQHKIHVYKIYFGNLCNILHVCVCVFVIALHLYGAE